MPTETNTIQEKKSAMSRIFKIFFILLVLVLIGLALWLWRYAQSPAVSRDIRVIEPTAEAESQVENARTKERFEGKYLSFSRLAAYKLKRQETEAREKILETAFFAEESVNSKKISLTMEKTEGNLDDNSSYKMRQMNGKKYTPGKFQMGKIKAETFVGRDESYFEKVFFIIKEDKLAMLAFSAPYPASAELEAEADEIAGSVVWKE
jgi:hypothetical protein